GDLEDDALLAERLHGPGGDEVEPVLLRDLGGVLVPQRGGSRPVGHHHLLIGRGRSVGSGAVLAEGSGGRAHAAHGEEQGAERGAPETGAHRPVSPVCPAVGSANITTWGSERRRASTAPAGSPAAGTSTV